MRGWFAGAPLAAAVCAVAAAGLPVHDASPADDPFSFFRPWIVTSAAEREAVDRRDVIVRTLPSDDRHLAVFAAVRIDAPAAAFVAWAQHIERLKRGEFVTAAGRFSDPPVLQDVSELMLDAGDLDDLRTCEPGRCGVKLAGDEIRALRAAIDQGGGDWQAAAQAAFRRVTLERVRRYGRRGLAGLAPYADTRAPGELDSAFDALLMRSPYLSHQMPGLVGRLRGGDEPPAGELAYFYWSKERYGAGKSVVSVSHVRIELPPAARGSPAMVMTSQQVFATHYSTAALGLTTLTCPEERGPCYLTYVNRSEVDVLGGMLGGVKRMALERRIRRDTPRLLTTMRQRVEGGPPLDW